MPKLKTSQTTIKRRGRQAAKRANSDPGAALHRRAVRAWRAGGVNFWAFALACAEIVGSYSARTSALAADCLCSVDTIEFYARAGRLRHLIDSYPAKTGRAGDRDLFIESDFWLKVSASHAAAIGRALEAGRITDRQAIDLINETLHNAFSVRDLRTEIDRHYPAPKGSGNKDSAAQDDGGPQAADSAGDPGPRRIAEAARAIDDSLLALAALLPDPAAWHIKRLAQIFRNVIAGVVINAD